MVDCDTDFIFLTPAGTTDIRHIQTEKTTDGLLTSLKMHPKKIIIISGSNRSHIEVALSRVHHSEWQKINQIMIERIKKRLLNGSFSKESIKCPI